LERRCITVLTTLKITRMWIEGIEKIEATEPWNPQELTYSKRELTIWTTRGEKVELILEADTAEHLEFNKPDDSWLTPKVYNGTGEEA
jgi:hypothetical protein